MTKRKAKKQAEPTTLDRVSAAADGLFGEAVESAMQKAVKRLDIPEVPELPEVEPETDEVDVDD